MSDEAYIADIEGEDTPLIVQKKDGTTLYATRDLAQIKYRSTLGIVKNIMVVDTAQSLHFRQVFAVAKKLGLNKNGDKEIELKHVVFGRMALPNKNMSTRKGNVILLDNLIDEAIKRASKLIETTNPRLDNKEKEEIAKISGLGSIKYNVLSQNRIHNLTFVWDKMISLDGNCAPYLQYTYARAKSILRKNEDKLTDEYVITENIEIDLIKKILDFPDALRIALETDMPHHIAIYSYELATLFNSFYNSNQVLKSEEKIKNLRIKLIEIISTIIKTSLNLLVIDAPEKM